MASVETRYGMAIAGLAVIAAVVLLAGRAEAGFDGFDVDSSTFVNQYNGNDVFDGSAFNNQWVLAGGGTELDYSLNGTNMVHTETTANGWIQHDDGTTPWELGSGSWTVEVNTKLNDTNPDLNDGFVVWTDLNGDNQIIWLQGDSVNLLDGTELLGGIDNTDAFHTVRVAFDSTESAYHVFRDDVQVTPPAGIVRRGTTANTRLLVGDCCTGIGNPIDEYEVAYIRYDMSGAFSPGPDQGEIALDIDRATGAMVINNTSGTSLDLLGYSIRSAAGALEQSQWTTIADNYDVNGDGSVDGDDPWTVLTASGSATDLSEAELVGGDGGVITSTTGSVDLGTSWLRTPIEDVTIEALTTDGTLLSSANGDLFVTYSGAEIPVGDLAGGAGGGPDGVIDLNDWVALKAGMNTDVATLSTAQAYLHGDLDGDLVIGPRDYLRFVAAFDEANGQGAFQAVPEPTSCLLLLFGAGMVLSVTRRWKRPSGLVFVSLANRTMQRLFLLALCFALSVVVSAKLAGAQEFVFAQYDADVGNPATAVDIQSPLDQGFLEWGETAQGQTHDPALIVQEGAIHNGVNAWRNSDDGPTNPGYLVDLTDDNLQTMFNFGWQYELVATLVRGGHFTAWGVDATNPWDTGGRGRIGVAFGSSDTATTLNPVAGEGGELVDLGPDSLNGDFIRILLTGEPLTTNFTFEVFDFNSGAQIGTTQQLSGFGGSNALNDNRFGLQSGSSGGTERELLLHSIHLQAFEPPRLTLEVNTSTGATSILNEAGESIALNGYFISSTAGALDPSGWLSLEDQDFGNPADPTPGDKDNGDGWEEFDSVDLGYLAEGFLLDFTSLADQDSLSLGGAFEPSVFGVNEEGDLVFEFTDGMGRLTTGNVQYVTGPDVVLGDVNLDTMVNGLDVDPFVDVLLNGPFQAEADMNLDGVVNGLDVDPFVAAVVGGGLQAVPEPSTIALLALAGLALCFRRARGDRMMMGLGRSWNLALVVAAGGLLVLLASSAARANSTNDRAYLFGDDTGIAAQNENATAGEKVGSGAGGVTFDTVSQGKNPANDSDAQNLSPSATAGPTYVSVGQGPFQRTAADGDPTPPAAGDLGAQFSGSGEYLRGARLGLPETAAGSIGYGDVVGGAVWNPNDYTGISNRGYQLWVYPTSNAAAQSVVMDTNQHGVRISAAGNWSMHYPGGTDVESTIPVATDQWSHVMLVRPFGAAGGGRLYVDGIVAAANGVGYTGDDNASLVLGSNTGTDADGNFNGGTEEFFTGVMDNLEMFVLGTSTGDDPEDFGTFDPQTDNQFIAGALAGVPDGDVNMNGVLEPVADVDAFVAGWLNVNEVNGIQVGDLGSRAAGDLNLDGITDLSDAFVLHEALAAAGSGLDFSLLTAAVPEPSTLVLLSLAALIGLAWRRR